MQNRNNFFKQRVSFYRGILQKNPKEDIEKAFNDLVLENNDFKRHVSETAKKLELDENLVLDVVTHYFKSIVMFFTFFPKNRVRIVIYSFFYLEFVNTVYVETSRYGIAALKKNARKHKYLLKLIKNKSK